MKYVSTNFAAKSSGLLTGILFSIPVLADDAKPGVPNVDCTLACSAPADWFVYLIIFMVVFGSLLSIQIIRKSLASSNWSLADALSEGTEVTLFDEEGKPVENTGSKDFVKVKKLCPSSSRMIALMGTIVILFMFLGFGAFALFVFAKTGDMPESMDKVVNYLVAGLTLFAPYVVNKFSTLFAGLTTK